MNRPKWLPKIAWHVFTWIAHGGIFVGLWWIGASPFILLGAFFFMVVRELLNLEEKCRVKKEITGWDLTDGVMDLVGPLMVVVWGLG